MIDEITITSTDKAFLVKLIDFMNKVVVEPNSTVITLKGADRMPDGLRPPKEKSE